MLAYDQLILGTAASLLYRHAMGAFGARLAGGDRGCSLDSHLIALQTSPAFDPSRAAAVGQCNAGRSHKPQSRSGCPGPSLQRFQSHIRRAAYIRPSAPQPRHLRFASSGLHISIVFNPIHLQFR
jgi:hypothetical protein